MQQINCRIDLQDIYAKNVTEVCFVKKKQSYRSDGERKLGEKPVIPDLSEKCLLNWYVCVLFNS